MNLWRGLQTDRPTESVFFLDKRWLEKEQCSGIGAIFSPMGMRELSWLVVTGERVSVGHASSLFPLSVAHFDPIEISVILMSYEAKSAIYLGKFP